MKVAIYEPEPRVCGPVAMIQPMLDGFTALGHDADFVSFTKSGRRKVAWGEDRPGLRWWNRDVDRVAKIKDAPEVLREYDLVYLVEARNIFHDKAALKEGRLPQYIEVLKNAGVPFTTGFYADQYDEKLAPFLETLLTLDCFSGAVFAQTREHVNRMKDRVKTVERPFAYTPVRDMDDPYCTDRVIAMGGRVVPNKGQQMAMRYMDYAPEGWNTCEIWGGSSVGMGPSSTLTMFEMMQAHGWDGEREAGKPMKPVPYELWKGEKTIKYLGNYTDPVETFSRCSVFPDLSSSKYTGGIVEFVALEAMDAGALPVVMPHLQSTFPEQHEHYDFVLTGDLTVPQGVKHLITNELDPRFVDAMNIACERIDSGDFSYVEKNRQTLRDLHDPKEWAGALVDAL